MAKIYGTEEQPLYVFYTLEIETIRYALEQLCSMDDDNPEFIAMKAKAETLVKFIREE